LSVLLFKTIFLKVCGFKINLPGKDWGFWLRLAEKYSISYINILLVNYRIHNQSTLRKTNIEKKLKSKIEIFNLAEVYSRRLNNKYINIGKSNAYFEFAKMLLINNRSKEARKYLKNILKYKHKLQFYIFTYVDNGIIKRLNNFKYLYIIKNI
jgi:hypothetical protein